MLMTAAELLPARPVADEENAAIVYEQAISLLGRRGDWPKQVQQDWSLTTPSVQQATWSTEQTAPAARVLAYFRKVSDLLAQARMRPKCCFNKTFGIAEDCRPPAVAAVQLGRLEGLRARLAAAAGRRQEALEATESVLALAEALEAEPTLLLAMVRGVLVEQRRRPLAAILESGPLSAAERGRLLALLPQGLEVRQHMQRAINAEMILVGGEAFRELRKSKNWLGGINLNFDEAYYRRQMREIWLCATEPAYRRPATRDEPPPRYYPGSTRANLGATAVDLKKVDRVVVSADLARIALWFDRHRQASGEFPVTLGDLGLEQGESLPEDPFSGAAYSYHRTEGGYRLWSVGRNGQDEGTSASGDDIVWEFPLAASGDESAEPAAPDAQDRAGKDWQAYWAERVRKARERARQATPK